MFYFSYAKKTGQQGLAPGQASSTSALPPSGGGTAPGGQVSDPMSALRSLAGQGGNTSMAIQSQPGQTQMTASLLGSGGTISTIPTQPQVQVQPLVQAGIVPTSSPNVIASSLSQQTVNPLVIQQTRFLGQGGSIVTTQQQRPQILPSTVQFQLQKFRQQQSPQQQLPQTVPNPSMPLQGGFSESLSFAQGQQPSPASSQFQGSQQPSQFQGQSPAPVSVSNQGPNSNQSTIPSPAGQHPSSVSSQMAPSPAGYALSPTSQITPSPVGSFPGRTPGTVGVSSPGSALNTPAPSATTPSPAARTPQDNQAYFEKLKQLSKYIEPLKRMIARIDKDEGRKKELSKMKSLLDILTDSNKRCSMDILLKCEQVLEKMDLLKTKSIEAPITSQLMTSGPTKPQEQNICQPLLDAVTNHIKSPLINHTLQRTFGPTINALCGPSPRIPSPPPKRKRTDEEGAEISDTLQGEIARLDQRFKVQLDPVQHHGSRTVHLICQLDDKNLPCVPPIRITVPESYPDKPPQCNISREEYESSPFLRCIQKVLSFRLNSMPEKFSVTCLLDTWEMSVRQACTPKAVAGSP